MTTRNTFLRLCCPPGPNAVRWTARVGPAEVGRELCTHLQGLGIRVLLELDLGEAGQRLKDLLLAGGLEVVGNCVLERGFVLADKPGHAVELLDAPWVASRYARGKILLLPIELIPKRIHR